MRYIAALLFFLVYFFSVAQTPQVPHKMRFAGMTLSIHDDARREIQKDVDALTRSPRHFKIKVERARTYFPIIEKIFAEERLPDDFKYLVLQESALIPDAVSVSDAVGFWQFKDFTAAEMDLRVDKEIDERMNIVSSTRAAARYLKKNNFYFNNWLYALQAYQMGAGGVMKAVKDTKSGARHMDINSKTYWYVKKYLAHKVAFEKAVAGQGNIVVQLYENKNKTTLKELAGEMNADAEQLLAYNKWVRKGKIPDDRTYAVSFPQVGGYAGSDMPLASIAATAGSTPGKEIRAIKGAVDRKKINGVWAVKAQPGESPAALAGRAGMDVSHLLKYNEININTRLRTDAWYFTAKKRARAGQAYHKVAEGEDLWEISQRYGVRLKKLLRYNRLKSASGVTPGTTLWLSARKPANAHREVPAAAIVEVDRTEAFSWGAGPAAAPASEAVVEAEPQKRTQHEVKQEASEGPEGTQEAESQSPGGKAPSPGTPPLAEAEDTGKDTVTTQPPTVSAPAPKTDSVATVSAVPANPGRHVVKQGETLYAISRKYDIGVKDLAEWNKLNTQDDIRPGQELVLVARGPENNDEKTPEPVEIVHVVKSSDTLYGVARKYNVTIKELMDWNNKEDFGITVGEKLKIYTK